MPAKQRTVGLPSTATCAPLKTVPLLLLPALAVALLPLTLLDVSPAGFSRYTTADKNTHAFTWFMLCHVNGRCMSFMAVLC
jgi:hypothetical protein